MKHPKPVTPERLELSALAYLKRFASSRENLRRVLARKLLVLKRDEAAPLHAFIENLLNRFEAKGYLNDEQYSEGQIASLRRRGLSKRGIQLKLQQKGIGCELITAKLNENEERDETAAIVFARRKRLGPFRDKDKRPAYRDRDLAALGRAGFDYQTARMVIDAVEEL